MKVKVHRIKLNEAFCDDVLDGRKNFEIRLNDRYYQAGDHIKFIPIDNYGVEWRHPISERTYQITYVISGYGLERGHVAFGIKEVEE